MGNLRFFENLIESKLLSLHTAYIGKVLTTDGKTAKVLPLGMSKAYGENAKKQTPLSNVPILHSARWKYEKKTLRYVSEVKEHKAEYEETEILVPTAIAAGDLVLCICCERDITEARKGNNSAPPVGRHSMSSSVIVGIL